MARISQETIEQVNTISILEIANAMGDQPKKMGKQYQIYCPNPAHTEKTPDTFIEPNRNIFKCFGGGGCGCGGNNAISYYAWHEFGAYEPKQHFIKAINGIAALMGIPVKDEKGNIITPGNSNYVPREKMAKATELKPQDPEIVDEVYRTFLSLCPVRQTHWQEWVKDRQYSQEDIDVLMLRSVPNKEEWISIYTIMCKNGYPFERVPGFSQRLILDIYENPFPLEYCERDEQKKGSWVYFPSAFSGYFIPVHDEFGRIIRLRIRKDAGKPKYIWFSSQHNVEVEANPVKMQKNGVGSGAPINVVVPTQFLKHWEKGTYLPDAFKVNTVIATEGEHKSAISSNKLCLPVWGAPGVGNYREMLPMIKQWGIKKFVIAYDMDSLQREDDSDKSTKKQKNLFDILTEFAIEVIKIGVECCIWTWNMADGKGLDDLLLNNKLPIEVNLRTGTQKLVNLNELQTL
ncbi:CHC2 zinc finger domain-containing protein [Viridibacillus arvi]|uniref:CHC2 zinc finger domain-containing protein n=1 Tax=Viridibacillus arvi TaxID=263475 RepID=UPI0034CEBE22